MAFCKGDTIIAAWPLTWRSKPVVFGKKAAAALEPGTTFGVDTRSSCIACLDLGLAARCPTMDQRASNALGWTLGRISLGAALARGTKVVVSAAGAEPWWNLEDVAMPDDLRALAHAGR